jgi:hypothetical protein
MDLDYGDYDYSSRPEIKKKSKEQEEINWETGPGKGSQKVPKGVTFDSKTKFPPGFTNNTSKGKYIYQQNMMNPLYASQFANKHGGKVYVDYDVDGYGYEDVIVTNNKGEVIWFNGHTLVSSEGPKKIYDEFITMGDKTKKARVPDFISNFHTGERKMVSTKTSVYNDIMKLSSVLFEQLKKMNKNRKQLLSLKSSVQGVDHNTVLDSIFNDKNYKISMTGLSSKLLVELVYRLLNTGKNEFKNNPFLMISNKDKDDKDRLKQTKMAKYIWGQVLVDNEEGIKDKISNFLKSFQVSQLKRLIALYCVYHYYNVPFENQKKGDMEIEVDEENRNTANRDLVKYCNQLLNTAPQLRQQAQGLFYKYFLGGFTRPVRAKVEKVPKKSKRIPNIEIKKQQLDFSEEAEFE